MSDMAVERLVNLALYLANAREHVTAEAVRTDVFGYPADQADDAFLRMFERDKDVLRTMGFVIESNEQGHYRLDRSATYARAVELSPAEAAATRAAAIALVDDPSYPFPDDLRLALAKISAEVESGPAPSAVRLADEEPQRQGESVALLTQAADARKRVEFGYTNSMGVSAPHTVEPYGLFLHDGRWYLVGRDVEKDQARTYTIARMTDVTANEQRAKTPDFERPADFNVSTFIRLPFQYGPPSAEFGATISIAPDCSWRARALAAGQGILEPTDEGGYLWRVDARSASRLLRFVIENGPGLSVEGPPELTDALAEGLAKVVALHG